MLTTAPPAEAGELLEATAQLTTMGRWAEFLLLAAITYTYTCGAAETHADSILQAQTKTLHLMLYAYVTHVLLLL
jgi:hypothetical protein